MNIWQPELPWWNLVIRACVVYGAVIILLRLGGKRQVGQLGMAEFVALLLISNAVQNSMNGGDNSLTSGILLAAVLIILSVIVEYVTFRFRKVESLIQGRPTLLINRGQILHDHLRREWLTVHELKQLLRKQGIHDLNEVKQAILESDGFISITRKSEMPEDRDEVRGMMRS